MTTLVWLCSQVLSLAPFIWKQLVGEHVTWSRDFSTVDEAEVRACDVSC